MIPLETLPQRRASRAQRLLADRRATTRGHMRLAQPHQGGQPAPFVPRRAGDLTSRALRQALDLWRRRCPRPDVPPRVEAFDILDYRRIVGCINLLEVRGAPLDFVFRVHSVSGADVIGRDMTGRSVWDYPDPHYGGFVRQVCRRAVVERAAQVVMEDVLVRRRQTSYDCPYRWEALVMPLCDRQDAVARLVYAFDLQSLDRDRPA